LIDVGGVDVEGHGGNLERDARKSQEQAQGDEAARIAEAHVAQAGGARGAVKEAEAVSQQGGRKSAQEEILQAGLLGAEVAAADGDEDVTGNADQLYGQEQQDQIVGQAGDQNPREAEKDHGEHVAALGRVGQVPVHQQNQEAHGEGDEPNVVGQRPKAHAGQLHAGGRAVVTANQKGGEHAGQGQDARGTAGPLGSAQTDQQDEPRSRDHDQLWSKECEEIAIHWFTSATKKAAAGLRRRLP